MLLFVFYFLLYCLIREGKLNLETGQGIVGDNVSLNVCPSSRFDLVGNLRLVPKFNERDPETFFSLFERVADARGWLDVARTTMLQCVLTGKAQEAYTALSVTDSLSYKAVKTAILKAFERVPEDYHQRFRKGRKDEQSYLEFSPDLVNSFNRWRTASGVGTFETLCDMVVLEQFKNAVPNQIGTYLKEQQVTTVGEAAALADQYDLTHHSGCQVARGLAGFKDSVTGHGLFSTCVVKSECRQK